MSCGECSSCGDGGCQGLLPEAELPTSLPVVAYDGNCGFCRRWMKRYYSIAPPDRLAWCPYQKAAGFYPGISEDQFAAAVHVVRPDGTYTRGAQAIFEIMHRVDLRTWPLWVYRWFPPFRWITEMGYRWVAAHRGAADRINKVAWGKIEIPSTTLLTRRIFIRLLGLIFLIAFLSLSYQANALFGPEGLYPVDETLASYQGRVSNSAPFLRAPSILWLGSPLLIPTIVTGIIAASAVTLGAVPMLSLALCWFCYLSLVSVGTVFLGYQWDALLLEMGFLAVFWAPCSWWLNSRQVRRPSTLIRWLLIWLLIRFMFLSGWAKLASGDPAWTSLTALDYHFWTQPLPLWTAWYAWQLPLWFQKTLCLIMFAVELGIPFLLLLPRMPRLVAFLALAGLQVGIILTGNYGFFNFLTLVLCIVALDDSQLLWLWPARIRGTIRVGLPRSQSPGRVGLNLVVAALVLSISVPVTLSQISGWFPGKPLGTDRWVQELRPWRIASGYGLFARMTQTRPEVILEGSRDGEVWQPYVFRWKPGPLDRAPGWCQPNMPRLDWQMWFVALHCEWALERDSLVDVNAVDTGEYPRSSLPVSPAHVTYEPRALEYLRLHQPVLYRLLKAVASGNRSVLGLLETSPFPPDDPPTWLRWHLDRYEFAGTDAPKDAWWTRSRLFSSGSIAVTDLMDPPRPAGVVSSAGSP